MKKLLKKLVFVPFILMLFGCEFYIPDLEDFYPEFYTSEHSSIDHTSTSLIISNTKTSNITSKPTSVISSTSQNKEFDDVSIHFLELGNQHSGDSVYIKVGDTDILIDASSRKGSAKTISSYINQYCTDNKLEYVIATHSHQDHIAGFVGSEQQGIFYTYSIDNIIDFTQFENNTQIYQEYITARDYQVSKGAKRYSALECYNNENGASRSYKIGKNVTLNILYQKYYEQATSSNNNYSVCLLLSQGNNHFLFTGDLESDGEKSLVENNSLPKVKLFKGGHHGSYTANSDDLLNVIQPENVCICTCCGTAEYTTNLNNMFPAQETINRLAKFTDKIYCTSQIDGKPLDENGNEYNYSVKSMNGNIVVTSTNNSFNINCSNNNTILKDTDWFKKYRTWPSLI